MVVDWTKVDEIRLLRWFSEFKPAGLHKHFHMCCIVERMNHPDKYPVVLLQKENIRSGKSFTASDIWEKLNQYYNFEAMDKVEDEGRLKERTDFELPWDEYGDLILDHAKGDQKEDEIEFNEDDQTNNKSKRRSTRLRKSTRLTYSGSDADEVFNGSDPDDDSGGASHENKHTIQPLAKRTRHSSSSASNNVMNNDTSPKKKKRKLGEIPPPAPQQQGTVSSVPNSAQASTAPVRSSSRVSSRLRNKK